MNEQGVRQTIQQLPDFSFAHDEYQELYFLLESYATLHQSFDIADFINFLQDNQTKQLAIEIAYQNYRKKALSESCRFITCNCLIKYCRGN